jgi:hypothetical protein
MPPDIQWDEIAHGFVYTHSRLQANAGRTTEALSLLHGLIELLCEKGAISKEDLYARQRLAARHLQEQLRTDRAGIKLQNPERDKYTFSTAVEIDCESRIPLCQAACCKLPFALSIQDVQEGIVRWNLGHPYVIAQGPDCYCDHLERGGCSCSIYEQRPVPCRAFDCRADKRIWLDFDNRVINPDIAHPGWPLNR